MLTLEEFGELRHLWLKYNLELKKCYIDLDIKRMKRYHKRILAVDRAIKCLIVCHPAEVFDAFICPTVCLHYADALTRHDNA